MAILDLAGSPKKTGELRVALWLHRHRVELRKTFRVLCGVKEAFSPEGVPAAYFDVIYDTSEKAEAEYNMHKSRVRTRNRKTSQPDIGSG